MDGQMVAESLASALRETGRLADELNRIADAAVDTASRLGCDNVAAVTGENSKAVTSYVTNRAENAARFAREISVATLERYPGRIHLDFTILYPLLRGALEDAGAITWLQESDDQAVRLTRILRLLRHDGYFLATNHLLLAQAAADVSEIPSSLAKQLAAHMEEEKTTLSVHYNEVAVQLSLDVSEVRRGVTTSEPLKSVYGESSVRSYRGNCSATSATTPTR